MLTAAPGVGAIEALVGIDTARLIVVDYAETRAEQLEVLLPWLTATATVEDPVRVLLLIRAAPRQGSDWTTALRHRSDPLDRVLDDMAQHLLEHLPLDLAERHALFSAAAVAFAMRHTPAPPIPDASPHELGGSVFTSPLMVVIAAYLAVHDSADAIPATRSRLLDELLAHEQRYWKATAKAVDITPDAVIQRRVVALATLAGAASEREATQLLSLVPDLADATALERGRLARWAHSIYPSGPGWWNPLEPDLVGEQLVATTYGEHPDVLKGVLARIHRCGGWVT